MITNEEYIAERSARDPEFNAAMKALRPEYEFRKALVTARLRAGLTQQQLAEKMGTTQSVIARLERGRRSPNLATLYALADALDTRFEIAPGAHMRSLAVA